MNALRLLFLWGCLLGLYLLLAGSVQFAEVIAGSVVAFGTAVLVRKVARSFRCPLSFSWCWLLPLWKIIPALFTETAQLYVALLRRLAGKREEGTFLEHAYTVRRDDPYATVRFGVMAFGICVTPNSYLVAFDRQRGKVVLRQLVGRKISSVDATFLGLT